MAGFYGYLLLHSRSGVFSMVIACTILRVVLEREHGCLRAEAGSFEKDREQVYYVKDNGVGCDMKRCGKMFGVFQRLIPEKEFEGTGAGPAIVLPPVTRQGGRVWAEASPVKGATFCFALKRTERNRG